MRTRLALLLAATAVAALPAAGSAAAPKPQVVDATGDAIGAQGSTDIVSARWSTTGDTVVSKVRGRRVTTYTPRKLVVTLNLAGAPSTTAPFAYEVAAEVAGCGAVRFTYTPGTVIAGTLGASSLWIDCGEEADQTGSNLLLIPGVDTKLGAKSITWSVGIKMMPKAVRVGSRWSEFRAAADVVEPVFGLYGTNLVGAVDEGTGAGSWVLK